MVAAQIFKSDSGFFLTDVLLNGGWYTILKIDQLFLISFTDSFSHSFLITPVWVARSYYE